MIMSAKGRRRAMLAVCLAATALTKVQAFVPRAPVVLQETGGLGYSATTETEEASVVTDGKLRQLIMDNASKTKSDETRKLPTRRHHHRMQRLRSDSRVEVPHHTTTSSAATTPTTKSSPKAPSARTNTATTRVTGKVGLTREEEVQYSFQLRTFRAAVRLRDQLVRTQGEVAIHPTEAEWAQACGVSVIDLRRVCAEGQEARRAMVQANVGLVTALAKRHYASIKSSTEAAGGMGTILALQDLIQEGNLGLMEAAERFQPERGFRFSTYATYWVRQRILRSISDYSRTIRLPAHVHSLLQKIYKTQQDLKAGNGGVEPSLSELAEAVGMSEEKVQLYTGASRNVVSLESPLRSDSSNVSKQDLRTLGDTLASDAPTPEETAMDQHLRRDIFTTMDASLTASERQVIVQRFGLDDGKPKSVQETADRLSLTRDRVRLVEARALNKLRHPQQNYRLKEYLSSSSSDLPGLDERSSSTSTTDSPSNDRLWFF